MARQTTWVSPSEDNSQAVLHRSSRSTAEIDEEAYHLLTFYATERALAISELLSRGQNEACILVLHFENYHPDNMPPLNVVRTSLTELQMIYPERITQILVLDPPRWLRITYGIVSMFLSKETRNKVRNWGCTPFYVDARDNKKLTTLDSIIEGSHGFWKGRSNAGSRHIPRTLANQERNEGVEFAA